jgi:hypothetical protein
MASELSFRLDRSLNPQEVLDFAVVADLLTGFDVHFGSRPFPSLDVAVCEREAAPL